MRGVKWTPSKDGCTKINFDSASKGNLGPSSVAKNSLGVIIGEGWQRLPNGPNNEAKAKAAILVVLLARRIGVTKLHLEGDSLVIVNAIICGSSLS